MLSFDKTYVCDHNSTEFLGLTIGIYFLIESIVIYFCLLQAKDVPVFIYYYESINYSFTYFLIYK